LEPQAASGGTEQPAGNTLKFTGIKGKSVRSSLADRMPPPVSFSSLKRRAVPYLQCSLTAEGGQSHGEQLCEYAIYIFDASVGASSPGEKRQRHLEHYWLCGTCAGTLMLVQDSRGSIQVLLKPATIIESDKRLPIVDSMLASS
jgi:hypothetical protein